MKQQDRRKRRDEAEKKNDVHMSKIARLLSPTERSAQLRKSLSEGGNQSPISSGTAEEALLWAAQSKTKEEKQLPLELVCTWTQAAVASERTVAGPIIQEPRK